MEGAARDAALAAVKAYLRVTGDAEDALIAGMAASAAELCEAFLGQWLVARSGTEEIAATGGWQRLAAAPVRAIAGVERLDGAGTATPLAAGAYEIDIDARGDGWVRIAAPDVSRVRVTFQAGLAASWSDAPEALAQGVVRLAAHCYRMRDEGGEAGPPAAVTALWRPWRRLRVG